MLCWILAQAVGCTGKCKFFVEMKRDQMCPTRVELLSPVACDDLGRGIPKEATDQNDNSQFVMQLVEHLILRSLYLYQSWKHVEQKATKPEARIKGRLQPSLLPTIKSSRSDVWKLPSRILL